MILPRLVLSAALVLGSAGAASALAPAAPAAAEALDGVETAWSRKGWGKAKGWKGGRHYGWQRGRHLGWRKHRRGHDGYAPYRARSVTIRY